VGHVSKTKNTKKIQTFFMALLNESLKDCKDCQ